MKWTKIFLLNLVFLISILTSSWFFYQKKVIELRAAEKVITSRIDFEKGEFNQTEAVSKEGELKLNPVGSWNPSSWATANWGLSNGAALVSDDRYTYMMGQTDLYFARYDSVGNKWKQLANTPFDAGGGSDLVVLGNYIYAIFGDKSKQRYFARYSKSTDTWEVLPETPDKMASGASLTTDGTYIYCTRGNWTSDFWKYNPTTKVWSPLMSTPSAIQQGSNMVYKDGNIYTTQGYYTGMYRYNIATDVWYTLGSSPVNFYENHNVDLIGNYMYVTQDNGTQGFYRYKLPDLSIVGGVDITNGGTGYVAGAFSVDNTGTGGSGLAGTYTVNSSGVINGITITSTGNGYNSLPILTPRKAIYSIGITNGGTGYVAGAFSVDNTGTGGSGLEGTYTVNGSGTITGITITNNGDGYNSLPIVTPRKAIYSVGITNGGSGYTAGNLIVNNAGTGGSGLTGTYTVNGSGTITGFVITNNGDGYNSPPIISPQPGGSGAVLSVRLGSGVILGGMRLGGGILWTAKMSDMGTWEKLIDLPQATRYVGSVYNKYENLLYVFRGNGYYDFWKYNPTTNSFVEPKEHPIGLGSGGDIIYNNGFLYTPRGSNTAEFYRYDLTNNAWTRMTDLPNRGTDPSPQVTLNDANRGTTVGNYIYFMRGASGATGTSQKTFIRYNTTNNAWEYLADTPLSTSDGASLVYPGSGDYIYASRGMMTRTFWRYSISENNWTIMSNMLDNSEAGNNSAMVSDGTNIYLIPGYGQTLMTKFNIGTTTWSNVGLIPFGTYWGSDATYYNGKIYAQSGNYKKDFWEYTVATNTWRRLQDMQGYGPLDYGPYNGGSLEVDNNGNLWSMLGSGIRTLQKYVSSNQNYVPSGSWTSEVMDLTYVSSWGKFEADYSTSNNSTISFSARTSSDRESWTDWTNINNNENLSLTVNRYVQFKANLGAGTSNTSTSILNSLKITYDGDLTAPSNPAVLNGYSQQVSGVGISQNVSYKYFAPYFNWSGENDGSGSGIDGYYVYFGESSTADPVSEGSYQSISEYTVNKEMTSGKTYYLRIRTKDKGGNISEAITGFSYIFGGVDPQRFEVTIGDSSGIGTTMNVENGSSRISLAHNDGFWYDEVFRGDPLPYYGSNLAYVEAKLIKCIYCRRDTREFWEYDLPTNVWTKIGDTSAPSTVSNWGAALTEGPTGYLYAFRGKYTRSFWRYDIGASLWSDEAAMDFPMTVGAGTNLVFDGKRYIYAIRSNSSDAFYRYDTTFDFWEKMASTDFGAIENQANNLVGGGSDLAYDSKDTIYVTKGNSTNGFAAYSVENDYWSVMPNLPEIPSSWSRIVYEEGTNSIYYMSGYTNFYRFNIDTQVWTQLEDLIYPLSAGSSLKTVGTKLYMMRGAWDYQTGVFDTISQTWNTPQTGLFGNLWKGQEVRGETWGTVMVKGEGQNYYMQRGNFDDTFVKYNADSGEVTKLQNAPYGNYHMGKMVYLSDKNKILMTGDYYYRKLFTYDIANNNWSENVGDTMPWDNYGGHSLVYDGSQYVYATKGWGSSEVWRYDINAAEGSRWSRVANTPGTLDWGAYLVKKDNYIYTLKGGASNPNPLYRMDVGTTVWTTLTSMPARVYQGGWLVDGNDGYLYATRGENTNEMYRYNISTGVWSGPLTPKGPIFGAGSEAVFDGSNKIHVLPGSVSYGTRSTGLYTYILKTENTAYQKQGSYISPVHDLEKVYKFANISVGNSLAPNFSFAVYTKTSADNISWSDWELASSTREISAIKMFQINSPKNRYIQLKFELLSKDGVYSGYISDYAINYFQDIEEPNNPINLTAYSGVGSTLSLTSGNWYNYSNPVFDWPDKEIDGGSSDGVSGAGVKGYYVYFGVGATADPQISGTLVTISEYTAPEMVSGNTYYLKIKAIDDADNVNEDTWDAFVYKYDKVKPINSTTIVADPPGYSTTNNYTFNWNEATDEASQIKDYCYKTGSVEAIEVCTENKSVSGIPSYQSGVNTFYVRARDYANNYANDYITSTYYYSSNAPSGPQNLKVQPENNNVNEFAFSWEPPIFFFGSQSYLKYYYSVNSLPTEKNVTSTDKTYLSAGAYAKQPGINTFYIVAKDEAGNIDYSLYSKIDFTSDSSAPGIPSLIEIADVSDKESKIWKLSVNWEAPEAIGSGGIKYKILRSDILGAECSKDISVFNEIESEQNGNSLVDGSDKKKRLLQKKYYYCVETCDNTGQCSAPSATVSLLPDGKWRTPPSLIDDPSVVVKTKSAIVSWSTNRTASSFVKYGKNSGEYGDEVGTSDQLVSHIISLIGLEPGTTYYYKVLWTDEDGNTGESAEQTLTTNPAPLISTVKISDVSLYSTYVDFRIKNTVKAIIQYGETTAYGSTHELTTARDEGDYMIKLEDLKEGTKYHLKIQALDDEGNIFNSDDYMFETLPVPKLLDVKIQQVKGMPTATLRLLWKSNTVLSSILTYYPVGKPEMARDQIKLTLSKNHEVVLYDLFDDTDYVLNLKGKDLMGNSAENIIKKFKTSADMRAPTISNLRLESVVDGVGEEARAQVVAYWDTDEPATSQIEYGQGTGIDYPNKSQKDTNLTLNHSLTIPELKPSEVYHLRVITEDKMANVTVSSDNVVITPKETKSALDLVIENLSKSFGFINNLSGVSK